MEQNLIPGIASSTNPTQVANTIKGFILSISTLVVFAGAHLFGISLTPDNIAALGEDIGMIAGAVWFVYGLLHKGVAVLGRVR